METCTQCGKTLTYDEIGLYRKMVNRGARSYLCRDCLAAYLRVSGELLDEKVRQFRAMGCMLFAPLPPEKEEK